MRIQSKPLFNIVLYEPEIPSNTGNIGRTCVGMNSHLHLIEPLGFELSEKRVRRAGLDYWQYLTLKTYNCFEDFLASVPNQKRIYFFSTKGKKTLYEQNFCEGDYFVFGKETKGLPQELLEKFSNQVVTVPFPGRVRSFNLSNTVSMAFTEGMRQLLFK